MKPIKTIREGIAFLKTHNLQRLKLKGDHAFCTGHNRSHKYWFGSVITFVPGTECKYGFDTIQQILEFCNSDAAWPFGHGAIIREENKNKTK